MNTHTLLTLGTHAWTLAFVQGSAVRLQTLTWPAEATLEDRARDVRQALASVPSAAAGSAPALPAREPSPLVLAIPSAWCLSARLSTAEVARKNRRQSLAFRLEEHLPLSAEDLIADYIFLPDHQALGVALPLTSIKPLVEALEAAGVPVQHISPLACLAAGHVAATQSNLAQLLLAQEASPPDYDWFEFQEGKPARWRWLADDAVAAAGGTGGGVPGGTGVPPVSGIERAVTVKERSSEPALAQSAPASAVSLPCLGMTPALSAALVMANIQPAVLPDLDVLRAAALHAAAILAGAAAPWIDLRRDALAPPRRRVSAQRSLLWLAASIVALLLAINFAAYWRGRVYDLHAQRHLQAQAQVFRDAFPDQPVPTSNIKERLRRQQRLLQDLSGRNLQDPAARAAMPGSSALDHFHHLLSALPADLRYRLLEIDIQPGAIVLRGEAQSHADAQRLTRALQETGLYQVDPPASSALRDAGVGFSCTAKPITLAQHQEQP